MMSPEYTSPNIESNNTIITITTPSSNEPDKPEIISTGDIVKPPTCYECGELILDVFEKIHDRIYCKNCILIFAKLWLSRKK